MSDKSLRERVGGHASTVVSFLKETLFLLRHSVRPMVGFSLLCFVFSLLVTSVLISVTTDLVMAIAGTTYIVPANLPSILLNPVCLLVLLAEQVLATLIALFQIAGLLHAYSMAQVGLETNLASMFAAGIRTCRKALHPRNWGIVLFLLVLLPLTNALSLAGTTYKLIIPGFVYQTIAYTLVYRVLYCIAYVILFCAAVVYIFSINIFVLRADDFHHSCIQSRQLGKGRYLRTVLCLGTLAIVLSIIINTVASASVTNFFGGVAMFDRSMGVVTRYSQIGTYTYALSTLLQSLLVPMVTNAGLTVLFYRYIDDEELVTTLSRDTFRTRTLSRGGKVASVCVLAAILVGSTVFLANKYSFLAEPVERPLVCAHRGDNVNAPENTMPAFELAFDEGVPWIELDVHQTSDGVIVVSHDKNLKRVTGHDLAICEHAYAELAQCEMLDSMPGNYEHVVVPTLEEVLGRAKERGVHVQVELKGSPSDEGFEERVLAVINKTGMHDQVMVIGQSAERMMRVAELDPTILKGYCMFWAQGHLEDIPYTDNVSIEETNVTPELVRMLHEDGVKVFCWTVDREDTVQYLVSCNVDVIGTDDPMLVTAALNHADYSGGVSRVKAIFLNMVANMAR